GMILSECPLSRGDHQTPHAQWVPARSADHVPRPGKSPEGAMDHDALPSTTTAPISHRIADVNQANLAFLHHSMKIMARKIGRDHAYESNATGHFAWDVSLMVRAACLGWRVTREPQFLEHAAAWSRHMIERTDEALGVVDWRGRTVPAWSAGSRYTAGTTAIGT